MFKNQNVISKLQITKVKNDKKWYYKFLKPPIETIPLELLALFNGVVYHEFYSIMYISSQAPIFKFQTQLSIMPPTWIYQTINDNQSWRSFTSYKCKV